MSGSLDSTITRREALKRIVGKPLKSKDLPDRYTMMLMATAGLYGHNLLTNTFTATEKGQEYLR